MKNILIFCHYYLPGYQAGGPLRTIANMVDALGDRYMFHIVCLDRDCDENAAPYTGIQYHQWNSVGKALVWYLPPDQCNASVFRNIFNSKQYWDLLYLQSFWDVKFALLPLLLWKKRALVLWAPRGEFGQGALRVKAWKKNLFLTLFRLTGIQKHVTFHCSSQDEVQDLHRIFGKQVNTISALDFPEQKCFSGTIHFPENAGRLKLCFLSRLVPKKNLLYALQVLQQTTVPVEFDIYGPLEDLGYLQQCQAQIASLPNNVVVQFCGVIAHDHVMDIFSRYDIFFFPTRNENFGHVIHEALRAGTPVLCSDQTPWHELDKRHAGWELSLDWPEHFVHVLEKFVVMPTEEKLFMRQAALQYGMDVSCDPQIKSDNTAMFDHLLFS